MQALLFISLFLPFYKNKATNCSLRSADRLSYTVTTCWYIAKLGSNLQRRGRHKANTTFLKLLRQYTFTSKISKNIIFSHVNNNV